MINIWRPDNYHGFNKKYNFFEGWYYKIITEDRKNFFAIIPGIILSKSDPHSFIQFYDRSKIHLYNSKEEKTDQVCLKIGF